MAAKKTATPAPRAAMRTTIGVQGARVHNLKNVTLEIPRDSLVVVTGLSVAGVPLSFGPQGVSLAGQNSPLPAPY